MGKPQLGEINGALNHLQGLSDKDLAYIMAVFERALHVEPARDEDEIDLRLNRLRYEIEHHMRETSP